MKIRNIHFNKNLILSHIFPITRHNFSTSVYFYSGVYEVCSKTRGLMSKICTLFVSYISGPPSKFSPSQRTHLFQRCFHILKPSWYAFVAMPFSSFVAFALISEIVSNLLPLRGFLSFGNKKSCEEQGQVSTWGGMG